jgi:hypothetical protein
MIDEYEAWKNVGNERIYEVNHLLLCLYLARSSNDALLCAHISLLVCIFEGFPWSSLLFHYQRLAMTFETTVHH